MDAATAAQVARGPLNAIGIVRFGTDHPEIADLVERHSWPRTYVVGRSSVLTDEPLVAHAALGFVPANMVEGAFERVSELQPLPDFRIAYLAACQAIGQRIFGERAKDEELATRLERLVSHARLEGLPLAAGWASTPRPQGIGARIERAGTILREHRGGLHLHVLSHYGLLGAEALIVHALWKGSEPAKLLRFFGWREEEPIAAAWEQLRMDGFIDADDQLTATARQQREEIERRTDELAGRPWRALDDDDRARTTQLLDQAVQALK